LPLRAIRATLISRADLRWVRQERPGNRYELHADQRPVRLASDSRETGRWQHRARMAMSDLLARTQARTRTERHRRRNRFAGGVAVLQRPRLPRDWSSQPRSRRARPRALRARTGQQLSEATRSLFALAQT
jgi:hypothetical protein